MKKKKAISILQSQKSNLEKYKEKPFDFEGVNKVKQVESYIIKFFGQDSIEYRHLKENNIFLNRPKILLDFIDNCISTIKNTGLYKSSSLWIRVDQTNKAVVWSIITAVLAVSFSLGRLSTVL